MRLTISQRAPLIVLATLALTLAIHVHAQTAPPATPRAATPTLPGAHTKVGLPAELQFEAVGATAQCGDGTFFHGKIDAQSCAEHHGIRKLLQTRGQDLIR